MKHLLILLLAFCHQGMAQSGPEQDWLATPYEGFGEFHGVLERDGQLLAWGDLGVDSVRTAVYCLLQGDTGEQVTSWVDTQPRSRFHAGTAGVGGFLLVGEARRLEGLTTPLLLSLDQNGDPLWMQEPGWGTDCVLHAAAPSADGGWIVGGERHHQALLARLDAEGDTLWTREFEYFPDYDDVFYDLAELPDGRIVACGQTYHDWIEWTSRYAVLAWFDSTGQMLDLFQPYDAQMFALEPLADGRLAVTGDFQFAYLPLWLGDHSGNMVHHYFGTRERDMLAHDIKQCPDGNLVVTGRWRTQNSELSHLLMKVDDQGQEIWRAAYDICGFDMGWGLVAHADGSFSTTGFCMPSRTAYVFRTTDDSIPVSPLGKSTPKLASLEGTSMAPTLVLHASFAGSAELVVFNLVGQRATVMQLPPGVTRVHLAPILDILPIGRYVLELRTGTRSEAFTLTWMH